MKFRPLALVTTLLLTATLPVLAQQDQHIFEVKTPFQRITIVDTPMGMRQMIFDGKFDGTDAIQSEMNKAKPLDLTLAYSQHMITALPTVAAGKPKHILVVGLGGACIRRFIRNLLPDTLIETAELDPEVLSVAKKYFNLVEDDHQKVHITDGRKFIEESKDKYDLIMLDAFSATSIPYALSTKEFLQTCKDHLAEGGALCANLWYEEADYHDMLKTYDAVFPEFHVMRCAGSTNAILLATPDKRGLTPEKWIDLAKTFDKDHPTNLNLPQLLDRGLEQQTRIPSDAKILLDTDVWKRK